MFKVLVKITNICILVIFVANFICACNTTNQQKKEFIKKNLKKTNQIVIEGGILKQKHGDLIIPDFVKNGEFGIDTIEM